jgi:hypothetical protein
VSLGDRIIATLKNYCNGGIIYYQSD